jgi:hypothetical protein
VPTCSIRERSNAASIYCAQSGVLRCHLCLPKLLATLILAGLIIMRPARVAVASSLPAGKLALAPYALNGRRLQPRRRHVRCEGLLGAVYIRYSRRDSRCEHSGDPDQPFQAIPITHSDRSRSVWRGVLRAPLDAFRDLSVACRCQVRREPVPVVNRRDPRTTRSGPHEARSGVRGRCLLTHGGGRWLALRFISLLPWGAWHRLRRLSRAMRLARSLRRL